MTRNPNFAASAAQTRFEPGAIIHRAAEQSAADPFEFIMSTDDVDRMGDVVNIAGMDLAAFTKNPIALWNHNFDEPIGRWENVRRQAGKLIGNLVLAAHGTSVKVDELRRFIEQRILKTVSVGFRVLDAEPIKGTFGVHFTKSELLECSLVPVPANAGAARIKALIPGAPDFLFSGDQAPPGSITRTGAAAPPSRRQLAPVPKDTPTMGRTVAERITAHLTRSASIDDELQSINEAADNDNGRDFTDDENTRIAALSSEKAALVENINTLQAMENAMAARAQTAGPAARPLMMEARAAQHEPKGAMLIKLASASALAFVQRRPVEQVIAQRYANDDRVAACMAYIQRSATGIADTTTPGWAAELVRQDVASFIQDLPNASVFAALRARASTNSVSLEGVGKLSIPMRTNKGNLSGAWVGEAGVIPVLKGTLGAAVIEPTKLAGITTFTRELMNATNSEIESILRIGMGEDTANFLDQKLLDNINKVAGVRPAGLQVGAPHIASTPGDIAADLAAAIAPILAAGGGQDIVLIMNPAQVWGLGLAQNGLGMPLFPEIQQGRLNRFAIIESANVPAGMVFVVDAAYYVDAAGLPEFAVSEETTLTMANADGTAPTQAIDAAGALGTAGQVLPDGGIHVAGGVTGAGTAGFTAMSMFQQYSVALRLIVPVHWIMRATGMVSVLTGVAWSGLTAFEQRSPAPATDEPAPTQRGGKRGEASAE